MAHRNRYVGRAFAASARRRSSARRFRVVLEDGEEVEREGVLVSPPFGIFRGHALAREYTGARSYLLVYIPERRILGSFRFVGKARALAAELAPTLLHGLPPPGAAGEART